MSYERIKTRQKMLLRIPDNIRIAEVGVWAGDFAADILKYSDPSELHLIDPWMGTIACGDQNGDNIVWRDGEELYREVIARFVRDDRIHIHRDRSDVALPWFPDGYFDFVYIDGDHEEVSVAADLELALAKAKSWIGGHDYGPMFPGVMRAVDKFCKRYNWHIKYLTEDGCPSFLLERVYGLGV